MRLFLLLTIFIIFSCDPKIVTEKIPVDQSAYNAIFETEVGKRKSEIVPLTLTVEWPTVVSYNSVDYSKGGIKYKSNGVDAKFDVTLNQVSYAATGKDGDWIVNKQDIEKKVDVLITVSDKYGRTKRELKTIFIDNVPPQIGFCNSATTVTVADKESFVDNFPEGEAGSGGAITDAGSGVNRSTISHSWEYDFTVSDVGKTIKRITTVKDYCDNEAKFEHAVEITS